MRTVFLVLITLVLFFSKIVAQTQISTSLYSYSYSVNPSSSYPDAGGGELKDGTKSMNVWPSSITSYDPLVGWLNSNPTMTFNFSSTQDVTEIRIWAADSDNSAGVGLPGSITITADGISKTFNVTNPSGSGTTVVLSLTGFFIKSSSITITISRAYEFTMLTEVEFFGPTSNTVSISSLTDFFAGASSLASSVNISGTGSINKLGTGALTLSGSNSYSGGTTVDQGKGVIKAGSNTAFGTGTIYVKGTNGVNGSGVLDLNGYTLSNTTVIDINSSGINDGGCLQNNNTSSTASLDGELQIGGNNYVGGNGSINFNGLVKSTGTISESFNFFKQGTGLWKFTNTANTFDGFFYLIGGTVEVDKLAGLNETSSLGKPTTSTANRVSFGYNNVGGGNLSFVGSLPSTSSRSFVIQGSTGVTSRILANGQTSIATFSLTGTLSTAVAGSHNFGLGGDNTGVNSFGGIISNGTGTLSVVKEGSTTWSLTAANTFTGATTVSAGVLNIQNSQGAGTTAGGVSVSSGAALELQGGITVGAETLTINGTGISNGGALRNITGSNTWGGTITLSTNSRINSDANTLTLNASNAIAASNQNLAIGGDGNTSVSGVINLGTGVLTKDGAGTLTLSGSNTFTGGTNLVSGTLSLGSANALGTSGIISFGGGSLQFTASNTTDYSSRFSGSANQLYSLNTNGQNVIIATALISSGGALTKLGSGILTMSGANLYNGTTTVNAGELRVNGSIASSSGLTVASGATLSGNGTIPAATISGTHSPGNSPGLQTVSGNLTYNNGATINWELISNAIGTRGTDFDGIDIVNGNLTFNSTVNLNLIFNTTGSDVDWTNAFWGTAKTGSNGWKVFELSNGYTVSGLNNVTINAANQWIDKNSKVLRTQLVSNGTFSLQQVGDAIYLTYDPLPLSAFAITGISTIVGVNVAISGVLLKAVDANGTTVAAFTSNATYGGTAGITGTSANFTAGVLTVSLTPTSVGSAKTLTVTNGSISGTATFDVVSSLLTGSQTLDGTSGNAINSNYFSTNGDLTLSQGFFVEYLVVGGGGGGGNTVGGGGGGAGVQAGSTVISANNYNIIVGQGGIGGYNNATSGGSSSALGVTASGGSAGLSTPRSGGNSGTPQSKSGGSQWVASSGDGAAGGGGAGAGVNGSNGNNNSVGGNGGSGIVNSITGADVTYAGGGGGGSEYNFSGANSSGLGGAGGGGNGGLGQNNSNNRGANATGFGSGGGGGGAFSGIGGTGSNGVVILRYINPSLGAVGGTVASGSGTATGYTLHTFTSNGSFNLSSLNLSSRLGTTLTSPISGNGNFTYNGPGTLVLIVNNIYTGNTTIASGCTLQIGNGGTTGSLGSGTISNSGTLSFFRSDNYTVPSAISGSGSVVQYGSGDLNLGGLSHDAGSWTLSGGSISNGTMSSGSFTLQQGSITAILAGSGSVTKSTAGLVSLTGTNTYSGTTSVNAGTLMVNGNNAGATGAVTVASGATLGGSGTIGGAITAQTGSTLVAGDGVGTLSTSGNVTLSAGSKINWQITDATGTAGADWDLLSIGGALSITATSASPVQINIWSVLANGSNGEIANFNPTLNTYSWTIATAAAGITGFDANYFQINTEPTNGTGGLTSQFSVSGFTLIKSGNSLVLQYSPPTTQTINGIGAPIVSSNYTTNTSAGSVTLNLGLRVEYLVIGGGGGGSSNVGGGGGGGGVVVGSTSVNASNYTIIVGSGGSGGTGGGDGNIGGNSSVFGATAVGGIAGESRNGGSSGSPQSMSGGLGWVKSSGDGAAGGGGGGSFAVGAAGGINSIGGAGGAGSSSNFTGTNLYYAGGGGGGNEYTAGSSTAAGIGGLGGGGNGGKGQSGASNGSSATPNTGGGGGGGGGFNGAGGNGGSGVVVLRYNGPSIGNVGGTITNGTGSATGYTLHTFTTNGNFNLSSINLNSTLSATLTGNIVGGGNLIYNGPGVLTLAGSANTYSGTTTIQSGELRVNSNITSSSTVSVVSGATLSGNGTLSATTVSGTHSPGAIVGTQSFSSGLTYTTNATFKWELIANKDNSTGIRGTDFDGVDIASGALTIGSGITATLIFNATGSTVDFTDAFWKSDHSWLVFDNASAPTLASATNIFDNISVGNDKNNVSLTSVQYLSNARFYFSIVGDDIFLNYDSRIPEITTSAASLSSMSSCIGTASTAQTFTVEGQYLAGNILLTAPGGYELSTDGTGFANTKTLTQVSGLVSPTTIYVRLVGTSSGTPAGSISITTNGGNTKNVSVSGAVYPIPTTANAGSDMIIPLTGVTLSANNPSAGSGAWSVVSGTSTTSSQFTSVGNYNSTFTPVGKGIYVLRWTISSGACTASRDEVSVRVVDDVWNGSVSSQWNAGANWASGSVPTGGTGVEIVVESTASRDLTLDTDKALESIDFNSTGIKVILGTYNLTIGSFTGAGPNAYIKSNGSGKLKMNVANTSTKIFPVGTAYYNPVTITNNTGVSSEFYATVSDGVYTNGSTTGNVSAGTPRVDLTWNIGNASNSTGPGTVDFVFGWNALNVNGTLVSPKLFHHDGSQWQAQNGTTAIDLPNRTLGYTGYSGTFSPFAVAETNVALPVNWLSFTAKQLHGAVELNWSTASEQNNSHFEVERSADALQFNKLGRVNAAANPRIKNDYQYLDQSPLSGKSFYRLKQVDVDGKFSYSSVIQINGVQATGIKVWSIPGSNKVSILIPQSIEGTEEVMIYDAMGRTLHRKQVLTGRTDINLNGGTSGGIYFFKIVKGRVVLYSTQFIN